MFNKKDPLIGAVSKIMEQNELHRQIEQKLCEELGIVSRKQLPNEHQANYDALLQQRLAEGAEGSTPKTPKEKALAAKHGDPNKITKGDVLKARGVIEAKKMCEDEDLEEGTMTHIKLSKAPSPDRGYTKMSNVTYKGRDIGTIEKYGSRWGASSDAAGDYAGGHSKGEVIDVLRQGEADRLRDERAKARKAKKKLLQKKQKLEEGPADTVYQKPINLTGDGDDARTQKLADMAKGMPAKNLPSPTEADKQAATQFEEETEKKRAMLHSYVKKAIEKQKSGEESEEKRAKGLRKATTRLYKEEETLDEKAPPGAKYERMVKHIKDKYSKDGLTKKEKSIAFARAWEAKNKEDMKEAVIAELRKNLGDKKMKEIEEERDSDEPEANAKPAPKAAEKPLADLSGGGDIAGGGATAAASTSAPSPAPTPAPASSSQPDDTKASAQDRASFTQGKDTRASDADRAAFRARTGSTVDTKTGQVQASQSADTQASAADRAAFKARTGQGGAPASNRAAEMGSDSRSQAKPTDMAAAKAAERGAPTPAAAPKPAPRPAARPAAAPAPAAKPAAQEPMGGGDDNSSPLAALRQYAASKAAGNFDAPSAPARSAASRPSAPRPAARPAPTAMASGRENATRLTESLENTIRKTLLKEQNDENN